MIPIYLHSRQELLERHDRQRRRYQEPPDRRDRRRNWIASIAESGVTDNVGDKMSLTSTTAFTNSPDNKHHLQDSSLPSAVLINEAVPIISASASCIVSSALWSCERDTDSRGFGTAQRDTRNVGGKLSTKQPGQQFPPKDSKSAAAPSSPQIPNSCVNQRGCLDTLSIFYRLKFPVALQNPSESDADS
jgi:hypothetical protein